MVVDLANVHLVGFGGLEHCVTRPLRGSPELSKGSLGAADSRLAPGTSMLPCS
jgi:hypothetical protein